MAFSEFLATPLHRPLPLFLVAGLAALLTRRTTSPASRRPLASSDESVQEAA